MEKEANFNFIPLSEDCLVDFISRYEDLVAAETRLFLLENALKSKSGYVNIDEIKNIFDIK